MYSCQHEDMFENSSSIWDELSSMFYNIWCFFAKKNIVGEAELYEPPAVRYENSYSHNGKTSLKGNTNYFLLKHKSLNREKIKHLAKPIADNCIMNFQSIQIIFLSFIRQFSWDTSKILIR